MYKIILSREESLLKIKEAVNVVEGANLVHNEYGNRLFANFFFFITGFHGFHVLSGVVINIIIFFNVIMGTYEKRGHPPVSSRPRRRSPRRRPLRPRRVSPRERPVRACEKRARRGAR